VAGPIRENPTGSGYRKLLAPIDATISAIHQTPMQLTRSHNKINDRFSSTQKSNQQAFSTHPGSSSMHAYAHFDTQPLLPTPTTTKQLPSSPIHDHDHDNKDDTPQENQDQNIEHMAYSNNEDCTVHIKKNLGDCWPRMNSTREYEDTADPMHDNWTSNVIEEIDEHVCTTLRTGILMDDIFDTDSEYQYTENSEWLQRTTVPSILTTPNQMNDNVYLDQNDIATNTDDSKETSMSYSRDQQAIAADAFLYIDKIMTASRASTHLSLAQSSSSSPSSSIQDISLAKRKCLNDIKMRREFFLPKGTKTQTVPSEIALEYIPYCMDPTPPELQHHTDDVYDIVHDAVENRDMTTYDEQAHIKRQKADVKEDCTREQFCSGQSNESKSGQVHQPDQDNDICNTTDIVYAHGHNISDTGHSHLEAHDRRHNADAADDMEEDPIHTIDEDQGHQATFNDSAAAPYNATYRQQQRKKTKRRAKQNDKKAHQRKQTYHNNRNHDTNQLDEGDLI